MPAEEAGALSSTLDAVADGLRRALAAAPGRARPTHFVGLRLPPPLRARLGAAQAALAARDPSVQCAAVPQAKAHITLLVTKVDEGRADSARRALEAAAAAWLAAEGQQCGGPPRFWLKGLGHFTRNGVIFAEMGPQEFLRALRHHVVCAFARGGFPVMDEKDLEEDVDGQRVLPRASERGGAEPEEGGASGADDGGGSSAESSDAEGAATKDATEDTPMDVTEGTTESFPKRPKGVTKVPAQGVARGLDCVAKGIVEDAAEVTADGDAKVAAGGAAGVAAEGAARGATWGAAEEAVNGAVAEEGTEVGAIEGTFEEAAKGTIEGIAEGAVQEVAGEGPPAGAQPGPACEGHRSVHGSEREAFAPHVTLFKASQAGRGRGNRKQANAARRAVVRLAKTLGTRGKDLDFGEAPIAYATLVDMRNTQADGYYQVQAEVGLALPAAAGQPTEEEAPGGAGTPKAFASQLKALLPAGAGPPAELEGEEEEEESNVVLSKDDKKGRKKKKKTKAQRSKAMAIQAAAVLGLGDGKEGDVEEEDEEEEELPFEVDAEEAWNERGKQAAKTMEQKSKRRRQKRGGGQPVERGKVPAKPAAQTALSGGGLGGAGGGGVLTGGPSARRVSPLGRTSLRGRAWKPKGT